MPNFLLPFGPFHMVLLHLPIGALTAIWFVEILLGKKANNHKNQAIGLLHLLLLLSCALTIVLGLSYQEFGNYGDEIEDHRFWGLVFGGCVLATYVCYWIHRKAGTIGTKSVYIMLLMASTVTMFITGHQGGELVHGKGFLTKPFKEDLRPAVNRETTTAAALVLKPEKLDVPAASAAITKGLPASMGGPVPMASVERPADPSIASGKSEDIALFQEVHGIFKSNCFDCHGANKQKGDFRIDLKKYAYQGGRSERASIVPYAPQDSEIVYRMHLPRSDDEAMPPERKAPLSPADIATIEQWITAGAFWPTDSEIAAAASHVEIGDAVTNALIEKIAETGVKAEYNAWGDDSIRVDLGVVDSGKLNAALKTLEAFGQKLTWIDASNLTLPEDFFQQMSYFKNLQRLHLDGTNVSDAQLARLGDLPKLAYLNLYNTTISDKAIASLQKCTALEKLYLSATKITESGVAALQRANPNVQLIYR